jgi:hypothetical protein
LRQRCERAKRKETEVKEDYVECVFHKLNTARDRRVFQRIQKNLSCVLLECGAPALL